MAGMNRRGGTISFKINGTKYSAKGEFSYGLGTPVRTSIVGADGIHGYAETWEPAFIEGAITDSRDLSLADLTSLDEGTITLELAVGKTIVLSNAYYVGSQSNTTGEGELRVRYESTGQAQEI